MLTFTLHTFDQGFIIVCCANSTEMLFFTLCRAQGSSGGQSYYTVVQFIFSKSSLTTAMM